MQHSRSIRYIILVVVGFATMASQIIVLRSLMSTFGASELTLGFALSSWMIWAGLSNYITGRFSDRLRRLNFFAVILILILAVIIPATILLASVIKPLLGASQGEMASIGLILIGTTIVLGPLCFVDGMLLNILAKAGSTGGSADIGEVYLADAIGAAIGGIAYGWIAINYLDPFFASCILSVVLTLTVIVIVPRRAIAFVVSYVVVLIVICVFSSQIAWSVLLYVWHGYNPTFRTETKFHELILIENSGEHTLFVDGMPAFTVPNPEADEISAHLPLIEVENPKRVLIVGGGISGLSEQLRKHNLDEITYVQIDPEITKIEKDLMGGRISDDVKIIHEDGRYFFNKFDSTKDDGYDVIIFNVGEPVDIATSRYYSEESFKKVTGALSPGGILFFGVYEVANYMSDTALEFIATIYYTLSDVFPSVTILPLDRYYFIASNSSVNSVTNDPHELMKRLLDQKIITDYLASSVLTGIYHERIDEIIQLVLKDAGRHGVGNQDQRPLLSFKGLSLWGQRVDERVLKMLIVISKIEYKWLVLVLVVIALLSVLIFKGAGAVTVFWTLFAVGWSGIMVELLLLIDYQVKVGMLFYKLGFIVTAFMIGLSLGAFLGIMFLKKYRITYPKLIVALAILATYVFMFSLVAEFSHMLANFIIGAVCGFIYQVASELTIHRGVGRTAGLINGADYLGAAIGSLLSSIVIIPMLGFNATKGFVVIVIGIAMLSVVISAFRLRQRPGLGI